MYSKVFKQAILYSIIVMGCVSLPFTQAQAAMTEAGYQTYCQPTVQEGFERQCGEYFLSSKQTPGGNITETTKSDPLPTIIGGSIGGPPPPTATIPPEILLENGGSTDGPPPPPEEGEERGGDEGEEGEEGEGENEDSSCGGSLAFLKHSCFGLNLTPLMHLFNAQGSSGLSSQQICQKVKDLNKRMGIINGALITTCVTGLTRCARSCNSEARAIRANNPDLSAEYRSIANECSGERTRYMTQGFLQIAHNIASYQAQGDCGAEEETSSGPGSPDLEHCDLLPTPAARQDCREGKEEGIADLCQNPNYRDTPACRCLSSENRNSPECRGATPPSFHAPTNEYGSYCQQNPEARICQTDNVAFDPTQPSSGFESLDPNIGDPGFDVASLGIEGPRCVCPSLQWLWWWSGWRWPIRSGSTRWWRWWRRPHWWWWRRWLRWSPR